MSEDLREIARKRIQARRDFWRMVGTFLVIMVLLVAVWAITGGGYFWPMWALFGFGVATLFGAWATFGPTSKPITEAHIDDEVRKLGGDPDGRR